MDHTTKALSRYISERGVQMSTISEATKIPYASLWGSLSKNGSRPLRADEFLAVCHFIGKSPFDFFAGISESRNGPAA